MPEHREWDVLVIGAGIAGLSAAIWARRLDLTVAVFEQSQAIGGQLRQIHMPVADYPGLQPTGAGELAGQLREQAEAAGAVIWTGQPVLHLDARAQTCITQQGPAVGRAVVMATGLSPRRLGLEGEAALTELGLIRRPSADLSWFRGRRVTVVGGGDRAAENLLLLAPVAREIWLIHRGAHLRTRPQFLHRLQAVGNLSIRYETAVTGLMHRDGVIGLSLTSRGRTEQVESDALCIYIGNQPNSQLLAGQVQMTADGYLKTDNTGQTSLPGVYAVGDVCTPPAYQSLVGAAGQAMVVAKQIALTLSSPD